MSSFIAMSAYSAWTRSHRSERNCDDYDELADLCSLWYKGKYSTAKNFFDTLPFAKEGYLREGNKENEFARKQMQSLMRQNESFLELVCIWRWFYYCIVFSKVYLVEYVFIWIIWNCYWISNIKKYHFII